MATIANPTFVDANYLHGRFSVSVYNTIDRTEEQVCFFREARKALHYAFILKQRNGILIANRAMHLLMHFAALQRAAIETRTESTNA